MIHTIQIMGFIFKRPPLEMINRMSMIQYIGEKQCEFSLI